DDCPCGSGRKFKRCCWDKRATRAGGPRAGTPEHSPS
ncbi:hypothetical protein HN937_28240, partial [Candidatus Poribacteria bacterium]|nr:hypothetical protein [Candidatus Poribacteria bacterium]